jgi:hypothetical protein
MGQMPMMQKAAAFLTVVLCIVTGPALAQKSGRRLLAQNSKLKTPLDPTSNSTKTETASSVESAKSSTAPMGDDALNASKNPRIIPPNASLGPFSGAFRFRTDEEIERYGRTLLFWRVQASGTRYTELKDQEAMSRNRANILTEHQFTDDLMLRGEAQVRFDLGYSQVVFNDGRSRNALALREAKLHYKPKYVSIEVGALDQNFFASPLLFGDQTFPAAREGLLFETRRFGAGFFLQQAVPTSTTLANPAAEMEPMPRLATESLVAFVRPVDDWFLEGSVHRYTFLDLPSAVSNDSRLGGNSVSGYLNSKFEYGFQGLVYGLRTFASIGRVRPGARFQIIENQLAEPGKNRGYWAQGDLGVRVTRNIWVIPRGDIFRIESDTSPAFYNEPGFRHNNRIGWSSSLTVRQMDWNLRFGVRYTETEPIVANPIQGKSQTATLNLETDYGTF